jgi:hypothetical protein
MIMKNLERNMILMIINEEKSNNETALKQIIGDKEAKIAKRLYQLSPRRTLKDVLKYSGNEMCADCGQPAQFKIVENDVWYYCGICEIG